MNVRDALVANVRDFVEREVVPAAPALDRDDVYPTELVERLGEMGFFGATIPEEYGGMGLDFVTYAMCVEELCRGFMSLSGVFNTHLICAYIVRVHGTDEQRSRWLPLLASGERRAGLALTEPECGSDVQAITTRARRVDGTYVVNGRKMFITNGTQADFVTTLVKTDPSAGHRGFSMIVVPTDAPGFSVGRKLKKIGNLCSDTAELVYDDVRVPVSFRVGEEGKGFVYQMEQFQDERLIGSVATCAGAFAAYERTKEYTLQRKVFGKPVAGHQVNQHRFVDMLTQLTALKALIYQCAERFNQGENVTKDISMAKLFAGQVSKYVIDTCLQLHGGYGYMEEYPIARAYRDHRLFNIGAGSDEIMKEIVAKMEGLAEREKAAVR